MGPLNMYWASSSSLVNGIVHNEFFVGPLNVLRRTEQANVLLVIFEQQHALLRLFGKLIKLIW
jgi:hypothetical protein